MFCPNCGAQNQETATVCAKCGFALKAAVAAPKFKGTMLMMNAPSAKPAAPAAPAAPPAVAPPAVAPPPAAAPAAPAAAAPVAAAGPKPKLKGTMIGVAPPSLGSNTAPVGAPRTAPTAPMAGTPAPPVNLGSTPPGFGAPPPDFGAPPPGFGAPPAAFEPPVAAPPHAPVHSPASAVNPLGGTIVADGGFGGGFPQAPAPHAGSYDIGAPPPGFGGFEDPGLGATAPAAGGSPMVPMQQSQMEPLDDMDPIPGTVGGANPIVTVLLIVLTCGIYGIYLLVKGKKADAG